MKNWISSVRNGNATVSVSEESLFRVRASRNRIEKQLEDGKVLYGVNTGFGKLSDIEIEKEDIAKLQLNLLRADAVGEPLPISVVRAMMTLRANALAKDIPGLEKKHCYCLLI
ncbi:aromatic amino acid lyase [Bacillus sp. N9]